MREIELQIGDIVQINPENGHKFGGFFCIVTEPKTWGCQGYLIHHADFEAVRVVDTQQAFIRLKFEDIELCGKAMWLFERERTEDENGVEIY